MPHYAPTTNFRFVTLLNTIMAQQDNGNTNAADDLSLLFSLLDRFFGFPDTDDDDLPDDKTRAIISANAREEINKLALKYQVEIVFHPGINYQPMPSEMVCAFIAEEKKKSSAP